MKILIGCECSGTIRQAFRDKGFDAYSCDTQPSQDNSPYHIQGDVIDIINDNWQLAIFHPPCTHLCVSGAAWFKNKKVEQAAALDFVRTLMNSPIPHTAIENPVSIISSHIRPPDQIIQPWQFGDEAQKTTCLWLKNLPPLQPTDIVPKGKMQKLKNGKQIPEWFSNAKHSDRANIRSKTFQGIADAVADQWGRFILGETSGYFGNKYFLF